METHCSASFCTLKGGDPCPSSSEKQGSTRHQARWSSSPRLTKPTPCTPRHETRKKKRCTVSTTPPPLVATPKDGHRNQGRRLRAGCSLPGPRWSRLGRWDAFVTHRPLNLHCVPPSRVQVNPNLAVWRWCEHGHSSPLVHTLLMTKWTKMLMSRARRISTQMTSRGELAPRCACSVMKAARVHSSDAKRFHSQASHGQ